jgi:hypothetical protein
MMCQGLTIVAAEKPNDERQVTTPDVDKAAANA